MLGRSCREHHDDGEHAEETAKEERVGGKGVKKEKAKRQKGRKPSRKARGEFQRQAEKPKP